MPIFRTLVFGLFVAVASPIAFGADSGYPGATYEVMQSTVLKVYSAKDENHKFVAYVVKWKDAEVVVSDPLAESNYKVGDTIKFLAQKISVPKSAPPVDTLMFVLTKQ